jgi:predicted permease
MVRLRALSGGWRHETSSFYVGLWAMGWLPDFLQDARYGVRTLRRTPGFALVAILTLAIGIGGSTSVFAVVNALVLDPLPVAEPAQVVRVYSGQSRMSWPNYLDIRDRGNLFTGVAAQRRVTAGVGLAEAPIRLSGEMTSANFFDVLGVGALRGRAYGPADGEQDVVVLADRTWRARFAADPAILGRVLVIDGHPYEVVGVMPSRFRGVAPPGLSTDFWIPVGPAHRNSVMRDRQVPFAEVVARLQPGITLLQARTAMRTISRHLRSTYPELPSSFEEMEVFHVDGVNAFRGMSSVFLPVFGFLGVLSAITGFVLFVGCANVAGLQIGRAATRRQEIATRLAVGASRERVIRQLLAEGILLALFGGGAGVALAALLTGAVSALTSRLPVPVMLDITMDDRALLFALGLSTVTSLIFGLTPAWGATRLDLVSALRAGSGLAGRQRLRQALVVTQIAVSSLVLLWSGLFVRSLGRVQDTQLGFDPAGVLLAHLALPQEADLRTRNEQIFTELQQRVLASPGVRSAGMALVVPLALTSNEEYYVTADDTGDRLKVVGNRLTPGWFETVRVPFRAGRDFTWDDRQGRPDAVIVNETLARRLWNGDALGKRLRGGSAGQGLQVVGVVADSKYWTLGEAVAPAVYRPLLQNYVYDMTLHVRTSDEVTTRRVIEQEFGRLAPGMAIETSSMAQAVSVAVVPAQIGAATTSAFGIVAVLLATLGVYGLVSFDVVQRTREIGIRKALGARTSDIVRLVVGSTARWAVAALAVGLGIGALAASALGGLLVGISPRDGATLIVVSIIVMTAVIAASGLPAWQAARVEPSDTLRHR